MRMVRVLLGVIAGFTLASNVYAANKTHVTDTLGAGNSMVAIVYGFGAASLPGTVVFASGSSFSVDGRSSVSHFAVAYHLGVTDRLDVGVFLPFSESSKYTQNYTIGANRYNGTSKAEGQGDVVLAVQYLVLDKQQDKVSWSLLGAISPSTASSDEGTSEVVVNGTVVQTGTSGQSGRGSRSAIIDSTISIPTGIGDAFLSADFRNYGESTSTGVTYKRGSHTSFTVGLEKMLGETITLTPYANLNFDAASTYSDGTNFAANSGHDLGLKVTNDLSKNVSVQAGAEYTVMNDVAVTSSNGDKWNFSGKGYTFDFSAMFFF